MLTTAQKVAILRKTGIAVPSNPASIPMPSGVTPEWVAAVNVLFVTYVAARAARSLRHAEEARQLGWLRQMSAQSSEPAQPAPRA